ncbi:hypothetical protein P280DRAFT_463175 [Massarina eburnea CBS 473.64]|uniref:S-adenosyl-L-methionine-dependent methyltransferase n=1 Tax=Massarina eburnea CBS 473.64 TaxID=1395130 RepID=A0A6A6RHY6_9PLEO|nr:hypothetical protein P280DRAFT_463175 [Massarina eburnea CBS 473.64]
MGKEYDNIMGRDEKEAHRLDKQFKAITTNIGYLVHPTAALGRTARVADVATGTAMFLTSLSTEYPEASLFGYDISPALFPPNGVPKNVQLDILDIKKPIPDNLRGTFDFVHIRLLIAAVEPSEWPSVVSNTASLLKPGGKLQWEEIDFFTSNYLRSKPQSTTNTAQKCLFKMTKNVDRFRAGFNTLAENMEKAGLGEVITDLVSNDRVPETRESLARNGIEVIMGFHGRMHEIGAPGAWSRAELEELEKGFEKDLESGAYVRYDIHIAIGTKPLA